MMRQVLLAVLAVLLPAVLSAQVKSPAVEPASDAVLKEMIVKGYVAQQRGKRLGKGRMIRISINRYDSKGRLVEAMSSTGADTVAGKVRTFKNERHSYRYGNKGQLLRTVNLRADGSVIDSVFNKANDKAVASDWYTYTSSGKPLKTESYTYDSENNWVKLITYDNGKPSRIIERVISYY
jgi:hypothetical protein